MKKSLVIILGLTGLLFYSCQTKTPEIEQYTIEQFMDNTSISGKAFSIDESKILYSSNETGIYNVYELDLNTGEKSSLPTEVKQHT